MKLRTRPLIALVALAGLCLSVPAFAQFDAEAAENVFKENDCHKCHHATKAKKGPALKKIAAKYKEKKLDEKEAIKHMTAGQKVKLDDDGLAVLDVRRDAAGTVMEGGEADPWYRFVRRADAPW